MTCTHIQRLLPLFIGGDLSLQKADSVRAHLFACQDCSNAAAEYEASQLWLASSSKPDFEDQFFENLRDSVWRDIRMEQRSGPRTFAWSWLFATAMLALLCAGLAMARRGHVPQPTPPMVKETPHGPVPGDTNPRRLPAAPPSKSDGRRNVDRLRLVAVRSQPSLPVLRSTGLRLMRMMPLTPLVPPLPVTPFLEKASHREPAGETDPVVRRMEIQTSDPTIRIIWLIADGSTRGLVDLDINE